MKLHFRILGEGPAVVIFHGLFGMSDNWQSFGRKLAEKGFMVVLSDLRNHGHSPHASQHNYRVMATDIATLIADLKLHHPVVIGHSMGGKATMQCLIDFPDLISKAVIIDIAPWNYPVHHREILDALLSVNLPTLTTRKEAENKLRESIHEESILQFLLKNLYRKSNNQFDWRFNLKIINEQIDEIGEPTWPSTPINSPVFFIKGADSVYIDPYRMNEILHWFTSAELINIPNAGHWIHADQPHLLLEEITNRIK